MQPIPASLLADARQHLVDTLRGRANPSETRHPWRKNWQFTILHTLRVEGLVLLILARQPHPLSPDEVDLLRLAAILHDIARLDRIEIHGPLGAAAARAWLAQHAPDRLSPAQVECVAALVAIHSQKDTPGPDFASAVLKDADALDEIGAMSIFMTSNWFEPRSPFFFHQLHQRLIDFELPYCAKTLAALNTESAREILREKIAFIQTFIAQLADELQLDQDIDQYQLDR